MSLKIKTIAAFVLILTISLFAQNRPFPQAGNFQLGGTVIKPSNTTQATLSNDVKTKYENYRNTYLKSSGQYYYIEASGNGPNGSSSLTISEAHGYGMMVFALMAGVKGDEKAIFDGMNNFRKAHKSKNTAGLMSWYVKSIGSVPSDGTSATDGDLDNAYALLLAYKQWGDEQYLTDAKTLISAIKSYEMHQSYYRTNLGDWDGSASNSRTSDWMPGHFRAFSEATGDNFWLSVANNVYTMLAQVSNSTTGLIPDFVTGSSAKADATGGGTYEENAQYYYYNACRDPWRLALDYAHHGTSSAKTQIDKISSWLKTKTNGNPDNIIAGYTLDGNADLYYYDYDEEVSKKVDWTDICFTAPFASGMIANSANQTFLNSTYSNVKSYSSNNAYKSALQLLNMLLISGNWWAPYSTFDNDAPIVLGDGPDLGDGTFEWNVNYDGYSLGSSSLLKKVASEEISFEIKIGVADEANEKWTYSEINSYLDGDWTELTSISISYSSDKPLYLVLSDSVGWKDEGRAFKVELPSGENITKNISLTSFMQMDSNWENKIAFSISQLRYIDGIAVCPQSENVLAKGTITSLILHDFVLYDTSNPDKYTVTFNSNGGTSVTAINDVESGEKITKPTNPTKNGYIFDGWYKEAGLTNAWNFTNSVVSSNITLYAKWTAAKVNITTKNLPNSEYDAVYSEVISASVENNAGGTISFSIKSGKLPDGLSLNSSDGTISGKSTAAGDFTFTITAKNSASGETADKQFTITIEKINPQYIAPADLTATYGQTLADIILPNGWFWINNEDFVGEVGTQTHMAIFMHDDTQNYNIMGNIGVDIEVKIEENKTVPDSFTVSFESNMGLWDAEPIKVESGEKISEPDISNVEHLGFDFLGWFASETNYQVRWEGIEYWNDREQFDFNTPIISDITILGIWDLSLPINGVPKSDNRFGIRFSQNIVSDKAEITVVLPKSERVTKSKITIFDMTGNVVYETSNNGIAGEGLQGRAISPLIWDLTNSAGRTVANGTYFVVAEVKSASGNVYRYSNKLGVKR